MGSVALARMLDRLLGAHCPFRSLAETPQYGVVELAEDGGRYPDTVSALTADPIAGPVKLTGERKRAGQRTAAGPGDPAQQGGRGRP